MTNKIYALFDPRNPDVVRYIGYTKHELNKRLIQHVHDAKKGQMNHRCNWIRSLTNDGIRPIISLIEEITEDNWQEREKYWIRFYKETLTNTTEGGEGLINPPREVIERISAKTSVIMRGNQYRKGISHTEESKKAIREGLKNSKKFKDAMIARKGIDNHRNLTDEQKKARNEKIRLANLNREYAPISDEIKKKMSESHIGKKHTEETKEKIRLANIGNTRSLGMKMPESAKDAIRAAKLGSKYITNGVQCKVLKAGEPLPEGWSYKVKSKEK